MIGWILVYGTNAAVQGDVAVMSTPLGREQAAVKVFFKSDAVVEAQAESSKQLHVLRIFKGPKELPAHLPISLEPNQSYLLFLVKTANGWGLSPLSLWDGYLEGDPAKFGYLPAGGKRIAKLQDDATFRTVDALIHLDSPSEAERYAGIRVLARGLPAYTVGGETVLSRLRALREVGRERLLREILEEGIAINSETGSDLTRLALEWKLSSVAGWACEHMRPLGMPHWPDPVGTNAGLLCRAFGKGKARTEALAFLLSALIDRPVFDNHHQTAEVIADLKDPELDGQMRRWLTESLEGEGKKRVGAALVYFRARAVLGPKDVKSLLRIVQDKEAEGRSTWGEASVAIEILEKIAGRTFRFQSGRAPAYEIKQVNVWWSSAGSSDPRYR